MSGYISKAILIIINIYRYINFILYIIIYFSKSNTLDKS